MNAGIMLFGVAALCALVFLIRGIEGDRRTGYGAMVRNVDAARAGWRPGGARDDPDGDRPRDPVSTALAVLGVAAAAAGAYLRYLGGSF